MALTKISYGEFEFLQLLVRSGDWALIDLTNLLPMLKASEIGAVVRSLSQKGIIRCMRNKAILRQPITEVLEILKPYRVKRAVILAAGLGTRMRPATNTLPKPMMLIHQKRLIETQLDALLAVGITDITIVRGYLGEAFDSLQINYPSVKFIDSPSWHLTGAVVSANLAIDLLENAYLIEGDLFIKEPKVIRPYEYRSSYCGVQSNIEQDWHFFTDSKGLIKRLVFGDFNNDLQNFKDIAHKFVGIMYWTSEHARQLKNDLSKLLQDPAHKHQFIESVPFDLQTGEYNIFVRQLLKSEVVEVDTYEDLLSLRALERQG